MGMRDKCGDEKERGAGQAPNTRMRAFEMTTCLKQPSFAVSQSRSFFGDLPMVDSASSGNAGTNHSDRTLQTMAR
jgi:hypothetical protein